MKILEVCISLIIHVSFLVCQVLIIMSVAVEKFSYAASNTVLNLFGFSKPAELKRLVFFQLCFRSYGSVHADVQLS